MLIDKITTVTDITTKELRKRPQSGFGTAVLDSAFPVRPRNVPKSGDGRFGPLWVQYLLFVIGASTELRRVR